MPVYLCQPGVSASEPWRHGIQVYATPFPLDEAAVESSDKDMAEAPTSSSDIARWANNNPRSAGSLSQNTTSSIVQSDEVFENRSSTPGVPIRRVRHSEIVLVDDVCIAFDRYWLRLRWPGSKGGFAGYIALGKVNEPQWIKRSNSNEQGTYSFLCMFFLISNVSLSQMLVRFKRPCDRRNSRNFVKWSR